VIDPAVCTGCGLCAQICPFCGLKVDTIRRDPVTA
jgi:ferredoxin